MMIRIMAGSILGGIIGFFAGIFMQRIGGKCPLVCNPWRATVTGLIVGLIVSIKK